MNTSQKETAFALGVAKGNAARLSMEVTPEWRAAITHWMRLAYPRCRDLDLEAEIMRLDAERLANPPDLIRYPETRGWPDRVRAERQGFLQGAGCDENAMAFYYSRSFFSSRRLNTRYAGTSPEVSRAHHCTAVYIRESHEGGALFGRNVDDVRRSRELETPALALPAGPASLSEFPSYGQERCLLVSEVSSAVLGDEEPVEIFPLDVWDVMPPDCTCVEDYIEFLTRYREFWGPCNGIIVDRQGDAIAYEKSNCRLGIRRSENGTAAVTACAYLIPSMHDFKQECAQRVLSDDAPDWEYWDGCEARYRRLLQLTDEANQRGATLEDMEAIVTDHAVPFPERICLAGEKIREDEVDANWTVTSLASVITGPARRTLFWRVEGDMPCYSNPPFLIPGTDVEICPEWCGNIRGGGGEP